MAGLCILLTVACGYDYKKKRIPNILTAAMAVLGICSRTASEGAAGAAAYLCGCLCVMCILYPFFKIGTVGAGDVKLLGISAGFLPFGKGFCFLFVTLLAASAVSLGRLLGERNFRERVRYLSGYLRRVAQSGRWQPYHDSFGERSRLGVCLTGPALFSILMYLGGVY